MPSGHIIEVALWGEQWDVGISENEIDDVVIWDKNGNDVTDCFHIEYENGVLNVLEPK